MKKTVKEQCREAHQTVAMILHTIGDEKILLYLATSFEEDLYDLDKDIEDERNFANENKTGAYQSAGSDARKRLKYLKKIRKEQAKLQKMLEQVISQRNKVQKAWLG